METAEIWDVVIIGGGMAGMVAANRAAELGLRPLILEKGADERYACNSRYSGGALHICMRDIQDEPDTLIDTILAVTDGTASRTLAQALVQDAPRTYAWLKSSGIRFVRVPAINQNYILAPVRPNRAGLHWLGRGGDVLLRTLEARLLGLGGQLVRGARATELVMEGSVCKGVVAAFGGSTRTFNAKAVLLADGGYQGAPDLLRQHVGPRPELLKQRNASTGTGDGARMAKAVGAALLGMDSGFYGHVLCRDVFENDRLWPFPFLDHVATAAIVVDGNGNRFTDEGQGGVYLANHIAKLSDPLSSVVIFDEPIWQGAGRYRAIPPNPHLVLAGGTVNYHQSLSGLAMELGLPLANLQRTVTEYNAAVASGTSPKLSPSRTATIYKPYPIERPPFYAVRVCAGITYTMGGIGTDEHGRVLRNDASPIPGLFAAGATTGGLEGGPRYGYVGGLMKSAVFGLRVAEYLGAAPVDHS
jgi:fumarate reductase flavoprotein subunit